jgi:mRNA interferase RelE/StbE
MGRPQSHKPGPTTGGQITAAIVEFMVGALCEEPEQVGRPLLREIAGYHSARRGRYRIIYRIVVEDHIVRVVRIEHQSDVYRDR